MMMKINTLKEVYSLSYFDEVSCSYGTEALKCDRSFDTYVLGTDVLFSRTAVAAFIKEVSLILAKPPLNLVNSPHESIVKNDLYQAMVLLWKKDVNSFCNYEYVVVAKLLKFDIMTYRFSGNWGETCLL